MKNTAIYALGRRKSAIARVHMKPGSGNISVNKEPHEKYFGRKILTLIIKQPLVVCGAVDKFDISVNVAGGGPSGQAGAARLAIARALVKFDDTNRGPLRKNGYLTRDPRAVERKKYGHHKARRRPQYSKR